jgi:hypothetical protein
VREAEKRYGVPVNDHLAVQSYNDQLEIDHGLFGELLSLDELAKALDTRDAGRLGQVHAYVAKMLEAEPVYFSFFGTTFPRPEPVLVDGVELYPYPKEFPREMSVQVAFAGERALVRDVFNGWTSSTGASRPVELPGRDRWYRAMGSNTLANYLFSPALMLWKIQIEQLKEGRTVTMPAAPVSPGMLSRET